MCDFVAIQGLELNTIAILYRQQPRAGTFQAQVLWKTSSLLVDPLGLGVLPLEDLGGREPEGNLLLGVLDAVGAVADVAADIDGVVTTDGAGGGGQGVGGTEDGAAGLDGVLALPDHGADGAAQHV